MATTHSNSCNCSLANIQRMGDALSRDSLPVDKILQIGSEFSVQLQRTIECKTCVVIKRVSQALSQLTLRIICFYEAAYVDSIDKASSGPISSCSFSSSEYISTTRTSVLERAGSPTASADQRRSRCNSTAREMKLGEMPIDGLEGRLLIRVVLVDACLEFSEKIQEWKATLEESTGLEDQQYLAQYNAFTGRCLDRLANLIGLLRIDDFLKDRS